MRPDEAAPPLSIRLFGPFEVRLNGRPLSRLTYRKSQSVLALLALRHGCEVEREWLAGLVWPDAASTAAFNGLRKCLTDLRHALGPEAGRLRSPMPRTLCLDLTGAFVDVLAYDAAVARGDARSLVEAVAVYRGELLEGWEEEWLFEERQRREQAYLAGLEELAGLARERGELVEAERLLRLMVAVDPLRESAQRSLMAVLAEGGCYAAALLTYRELRKRLHRELNTEPDPETKALFERLRGQARQKAAARGDARSTRFAGTRASDAIPSDGRCGAAGSSFLAPVISRRASSLATAPGENRLVTVLFAVVSRSVETVPDLDPEEAAAGLSRLLGVMADTVLKFGGRVDRFLGDGVLATFGAPQAHEDDAERAISAALGIRDGAARLGHRLMAGINTGIVYAGAVGTEQHRESTVVGPVVDLASRLREQASPGQILLGTATYHLTRRAFEFSSHSPAADVAAEPVVAYSVTQALARPEKARGVEGLRTPLIGRDEELSKLQAALAELLRGRGQMLSLIGEAGVGKSRLIAELRAAVGSRQSAVGSPGGGHAGMTANAPSLLPTADCLLPTPLWLEGRCLELASTDRFSLFVDLLRHYFTWPAEADEAARVARIAAALGESTACGALSAARADEIGPLVADLFSLRWGDDDPGTQNADPEQRRQQTFLAIQDLLLALARQQPLVLVLEDLHWADSLSLDLISLLMEPLAGVSLFLLCSYRSDPAHRCSRLGTIAAQKCPECFTELRLRGLTPLQSQQLVAALLGTPELPPAAKELILDRSRGNPFFMEELVHSLLDQGVLYREGGTWRVREEAGRRVPEGIQGVIRSRVDRLEPELRHLLQYAAVLGRVFHRRLLEAALEEEASLDRRLWELEEQELIYQERVIPEEEYSFRHVLVQETVYAGILRSQRAGLHLQVAQAIERLYSERLDAYCEQLAFHYEQSGADDLAQERALHYLIRAADRAHRTAAHREEAALLTRAIDIAERLGRRGVSVELRGRRGTAFARVAMWPEARPDLEAAVAGPVSELSDERIQRLVDLAIVCHWVLDVPSMRRYAAAALALAEEAGRDDLAAGAMGALALADSSDGDLSASRSQFERALVRTGEIRIVPLPASLHMSALVLYFLGRLPEAIERARKMFEVGRAVNDTSSATLALGHLGLALMGSGRYDEAMEVLEEMRLFSHEHGVGRGLARCLGLRAGLLLEVWNFPDSEAFAEQAREAGRSLAWGHPVISGGIDLLLNFARSHEVGRAEKLVDEVAESIRAGANNHGWLWRLRFAQARAEIALARGDWDEAARWAEAVIAQSRASGRVKYQAGGLGARGRALVGRGRKREGIAALQEAVLLARPVGDPTMFLRAATALLELDGDGDMAAEARAAAKQIAAALPDQAMRRHFEAAAPVRLLGALE